MKKTTLVVICILAISGFIGVSPFILDNSTLDFHKEKFNASVTVMDKDDNISLGINSDPKLDFGNIPQGSNSTKFLNISTGKKSALTISSDGNISEFLEYHERMYFQGDKRIELEMKGKSPGNFTGNVSLKFEIPQNQVGKHWLDLKYRIYRTL